MARPLQKTYSKSHPYVVERHDQEDGVQPDDRGHVWFKPDWLAWECCKVCGIVRRKDGIANKPCRGPVSVGPRGHDEAGK